MNDLIKFKLISPNKMWVDRSVKSIYVPTVDGLIGILPMHSNLITGVSFGVIKIENEDGSLDVYYINDGLVNIFDNTCSIMSESISPLDSLDKASIQEKISSISDKKELDILKDMLKNAQ